MLCLPYLSCLFALRPCAFIYAFSFHCLSAGFLIYAFASTHMEQGCMKLGHDLLGTSKKGKDTSTWLSQATAISRFRSLAFSLWLCTLQTPFFLLPFSLKCFVLGISCFVPFVLISKVWQPLLIFLHLYFGPYFRDVGIYFPTLCASIVHDACIYMPAHPFPV